MSPSVRKVAISSQIRRPADPVVLDCDMVGLATVAADLHTPGMR